MNEVDHDSQSWDDVDHNIFFMTFLSLFHDYNLSKVIYELWMHVNDNFAIDFFCNVRY